MGEPTSNLHISGDKNRMPNRCRALLCCLVLVLLAAACGVDTTSTTELSAEREPVAFSDDCLPDQDIPAFGIPPSGNDRRHEDIIELLTGERQTSDLDPVEDTIDDPNFGGVWGDRQGGIVVAVLDCSEVDASELARIAGGADLLHLIEVPHTFQQVDDFRDVLIQELEDVGVAGDVSIDSTLSGRLIVVGVLDPHVLPEDFGRAVPADAFVVTQVETLVGPA